MGREPRWVPPHSLQHVTDVTFQNRPLLCPSEELNDRFLGVLGRAQREHAMPVHGAAALSTHIHLLVRPRDARHLADFMCFFKANLSKEIGTRMRGWDGGLFDGRYHNVFSAGLSNPARPSRNEQRPLVGPKARPRAGEHPSGRLSVQHYRVGTSAPRGASVLP